MLNQPTPADPIDLAAQVADDAQFYRAVLHEMINAGVDHVRIGAAHAKDRAADGQANSAAARAAQHRLAARKRIIRKVEDVIQREAPNPSEQETLRAELLDRLDRPDFEDEIAGRPIDEVITDIVRDLGLASPDAGPPAWKRRTPEDIALLSARAAGAAPATGQPRTATISVLHPACSQTLERAFGLAARH